MRRTTLLVWGSVAVMGVLTLTLVGLWLAVRWYPEQAGPHLPPGIAFRMAGWGKQERRAAQICFGSDPRAISHKGLCSLTAEQIARRNAILCAALRGSRDDQVFALEFIAGANTGFAPASAERNALVYALISSPDEALRMIARDRWVEDGANYFDRLTTLTFDPATDRSPLAPDGWIAGPAAIDAWLALIYLSAGYDHKAPSRFRSFVQSRLDRLLAREVGDGRFAADERDQAVAVMAIAEAYAMTNDPELKAPAIRGKALFERDRERLAGLWQEDTTCAILTALAIKTLLSGGLANESLDDTYRPGLSTWLASGDGSEPPVWVAGGRPVIADTIERWGVWLYAHLFLKQRPRADVVVPLQVAEADGGTPLGRYLRCLGLLAQWDDRWRAPITRRRDHLQATRLITPDHQAPEGQWPAAA